MNSKDDRGGLVFRMLRPCALLLLLTACHRRPAVPALVPATLVSGAATIPYPPNLFARRIQGDVLLYLVVDSTGHVVRDSTRIAKSSGQASFDSAALVAAPRLQFAPARRGGVPVAAPIQVPVHFHLPHTLSTPRARP